MADYEHLLVKHDGDTVRITMNRPERRNSLTEGHLRELLDEPNVPAPLAAESFFLM